MTAHQIDLGQTNVYIWYSPVDGRDLFIPVALSKDPKSSGPDLEEYSGKHGGPPSRIVTIDFKDTSSVTFPAPGQIARKGTTLYDIFYRHLCRPYGREYGREYGRDSDFASYIYILTAIDSSDPHNPHPTALHLNDITDRKNNNSPVNIESLIEPDGLSISLAELFNLQIETFYATVVEHKILRDHKPNL